MIFLLLGNVLFFTYITFGGKLILGFPKFHALFTLQFNLILIYV